MKKNKEHKEKSVQDQNIPASDTKDTLLGNIDLLPLIELEKFSTSPATVIHSVTLLNKVLDEHKEKMSALKHTMAIDGDADDFLFIGNEQLYQLVFHLLLRAVVSAAGREEKILLDCNQEKYGFEFTIRYSTVMPEDISLVLHSMDAPPREETFLFDFYHSYNIIRNFFHGFMMMESNDQIGTILRISIFRVFG